MHDETQTILRCGLCNKPFDRQATLKRHGYYCRSRGAGPATRPRSCTFCAKKKARCDNQRPECSRCIAKGLDCHYPANLPETRIRHSTAPLQVTKSASSNKLDTRQVKDVYHVDAEGYNNGLLDSALAMVPTPNFTDLQWNDLDINFPDFLALPEMNKESAEYPYPEYPAPYPPLHHPTPSPSSFQTSLRRTTSPRSMSISGLSLPTLPRLIMPRHNAKVGTERTTTLLLHTLKSYLLPMIRDSTLPPFIHSQSISLFSTENLVDARNSKSSLSICINLMSTFNSKSKDGRRAFWDNVRIECGRLCAETLQLSKWDLLGAMQSLSIYILIRLDEGDTEHNNIDFLLLAAVTAIARQISSDSPLDSKSLRFAISNPNPLERWKEWIFEESRRRLSIIYRIINKLIYLEPAANCDLPADLFLAPLPAKRQLWEACSVEDWKGEVEREEIASIYQSGFGVSASGELVRLETGQGKNRDGLSGDEGEVLVHTALGEGSVMRRKVRWEEWCVGMDGMGGIVLLATSLV